MTVDRRDDKVWVATWSAIRERKGTLYAITCISAGTGTKQTIQAIAKVASEDGSAKGILGGQGATDGTLS